MIVTTYNVADYIEEAIRSIITQSYRQLEIIVVDDVSTDDTLEKLRKLQFEDNRIRIIEKKVNEGGALAKRSGAEAATGEYFLFCDGDDLIDERTVATCIDAVNLTGADCVMFGFCFFESDANHSFGFNVPILMSSLPSIMNTNSSEFNPFKASKLSHITPICFMATDVHRDAFCAATYKMPYFYDLPTFINMFYSSKRMVFINEALYCYRLGRTGQSVDSWFTDKRKAKLNCLVRAIDQVMHSEISKSKKMRQFVASKTIQIATAELPGMRVSGSTQNYNKTIAAFRKCLRHFSVFDAFHMKDSVEFRIFLILKYIPAFYARGMLKKIWLSGALH